MKRFALAVGMVALLMAAGQVAASPPNGVGSNTRWVSAYSTVIYYETFYGLEVGRVSVIGDGSTTLDVYVFDDYGRLVANTYGPGDRCLVTFTPSRTSTYRIEVRNRGPVANLFSIRTY
jgi:hypothetical protein